MRLTLNRILHPYRSLLEVADAFDVTVPHLKRAIRKLQARGDLSLPSLARCVGAIPEEVTKTHTGAPNDDLCLAFHQSGFCLVCGHPLARVEGRQGGWGEFLQCGFCGFSAHENADFAKLKSVAEEQLTELAAISNQASRIFAERARRGSAL